MIVLPTNNYLDVTDFNRTIGSLCWSLAHALPLLNLNCLTQIILLIFVCQLLKAILVSQIIL